ncbi:uncharacterized protein LOC113373862 [Ctenocephalides felis]|uniref:uncharacterized protein LOC113373862 n=1 Tax=Ctenocephalides felis TaxID=7515 RepID=UPI000E6E4292|nr:uncharacterized protein LOC113373862 [Ctenocephalides felis]
MKDLSENLELKKSALMDYIQTELKKIMKNNNKTSSECEDLDSDTPHTLDECVSALMRMSEEASVHRNIANQQHEVNVLETSLRSQNSDLNKHMSKLNDIDSKLEDLKQQQIDINEEQNKLSEPPNIDSNKFIQETNSEQADDLLKRKMSLSLPIRHPLNSLANSTELSNTSSSANPSCIV